MAKVKVTKRDGQVFEVFDLTFEQVKQLLMINNNESVSRQRGAPLNPATFSPNYDGFAAAISDNAREFFTILREVPEGVPLDTLVQVLEFDTPMKIGGVIGGGIAKLAPKFGLRVDDLYERVIIRNRGERIVVYKPGRELMNLKLETVGARR